MSAQQARKHPRKDTHWNIFDRSNYRIFFIGAITILLGYIAMMQGPHNSFWSLHLAPILLIIGYCVLIPLAILKRPRGPKGE
jgi:uncharacterized membrane protein HdeD (DUF308 family)